jgi:hypothetical protein
VTSRKPSCVLEETGHGTQACPDGDGEQSVAAKPGRMAKFQNGDLIEVKVSRSVPVGTIQNF